MTASDSLNPDGFPCFKCGTAVIVDEQWDTMVRAVRFTSRGNYGSTVWDPGGFDESFLRINICDECIIAGSKEGLVAQGVPRRVRTAVDYALFAHEEHPLEG